MTIPIWVSLPALAAVAAYSLWRYAQGNIGTGHATLAVVCCVVVALAALGKAAL